MIRKAVHKLWNSATFTSWFGQLVSVLQMLLLAPILLSSFDKEEIAAWYLFASINVFGTIVVARVALTFCRVITQQLVKAKSSSQNGERGLAKVISTMGAVQVGLSLLNLSMGAILGYFSLSPILSDYQNANGVWVSLFIYLIGSFLCFLTSRYNSVLIGFDEMALNNRRTVFAGAAAVLSASVATVVFGNIVVTTLCSQFFMVLSNFLARISVKKLLSRNGFSIDVDAVRYYHYIGRKVFSPIWKGMVVQISNASVLPLLSMNVAKSGDAAMAASFAFGVRILTSLDLASAAPINSIQPKLAALMAREELGKAGKLVLQRAIFSIGLFALGLVLVAAIYPLITKVGDSKLINLGPEIILLVGLMMALGRIYGFCVAPFYARNEILFYVRFGVLGLLSIIFIIIGFGRLPLLYVVTGLVVLKAVVINVLPIRRFSEEVGVSGIAVFKSMFMPLLIILVVGYGFLHYWGAGIVQKLENFMN